MAKKPEKLGKEQKTESMDSPKSVIIRNRLKKPSESLTSLFLTIIFNKGLKRDTDLYSL